MMVMENNKASTRVPLIAESVLRRMKDDPSYRPKNVQDLSAFSVFKETGETEDFSPLQVKALWKSLTPNVLRFSEKQKAPSTTPKTTPIVVLTARYRKAKV